MMTEDLPLIRITTDTKKNKEKAEALFQLIMNRTFNYYVVHKTAPTTKNMLEPNVEVFYSGTNEVFIQKKITEILNGTRIKTKSVLFMCDIFPRNCSNLIENKKLVCDFVMSSSEPSFIQYKIDQLIFLGKQGFQKETEKLLDIQHKIEYHDWFGSDLNSSLTFLLSTLSAIDWIDGGGIYFFTPENDALVLISHFGLSDGFIKQNERHLPDSPQVSVIRQKKFFFGSFENLQKKLDQTSNSEGIKAVAILPVMHKDKVIGCINLASKTKDTIPKNDQIALETIAAKIATVVSFLKAQDALLKARLLLESKVDIRTRELKDINQVLQKEISIHKETREALLLSENLYRSIFNYANDGIVLYDVKSLQPIDVNPKAHNDLGYTRDEFMKLKTSDFTIYESKEYQKNIIEQLFRDKRVEYYVKHKSKSNEIKYRIISANIITINNKEYILGIVHDITRLRLAEFEIKQKEKKIKSLQENISIGLFRTDIAGSLIYANKSLQRLLRTVSLQGIIGKGLTDFIADPNVIKQISEKLTKDDIIRNFELQIKNEEGKKFWVLLNLKKVKDTRDEALFYDGSIEDIAALKNTQLKLEKANRKIIKINKLLEKKINNAVRNEKKQQSFIIQKSKLESLGELAAGIAHEINQPLGIMSLAFENLQSKLQTGIASEDYITKKISSIISNIDRIRDIISHIRIFSREHDSIVMQKVDLNRVIRDVLKLVKTQYQNHNISLVLDLHENPGFTIGSNLKMEQVLLNLLSNAKYAVEENEFNYDNFTKKIKLKTDVRDNRIHFMIEDNGIGISPEKLNYIFDPFYTTKPEWVGTGLGLSIAYGIIKDMRGSISVQSEQKKFTRFDILLPRFPEKD